MPNRVTPIHRALGVTGGSLADLLPVAVAEGVPEAEDLDWKRELPHASKPTGMLELSTDLAAMANTSGGLIVYGVEESQGEQRVNAAGRFVSVDGSGTQIDQRVLQAAYQAQPPIRGVFVESVGLASGEQLYAVHIEASEDTPHLVIDRSRPDWFRAPVRHGAHTQYMTERQLEQAYNTRFRGASRAEVTLRELADQMHGHFAFSDYPVLVAVAVPRRARPAWADSLSEDKARHLFRVSDRLTSPPFPYALPYGRLPAGHRVRVGMRRWVDRYGPARSEIHHDGSIACAIELGPWRASSNEDAAANEVSGPMIEGLACEFAALVHEVGVKLSIDTYDVRVHIGWGGEGPVLIRSPHPMGSFYNDADPDYSVRTFQPVLTSISPSTVEENRVSDAALFARDLLAQVGLEPTKL